MQNLFRHVGSGIDNLLNGVERHSHTHDGHDCHESHSDEHNGNRYQSFAPQTTGHAKWYVDGCSYFWAVSEALEQARESIYILDWWLSPELYLRRPPARNEEYRLDRMLKAAAERGVQVRIIVYKEVTQALTLNSAHTKHALEALHPNIRVFRHPDHLPSGHDFQADIQNAFKNLTLKQFDLNKLGKDALKTVYGTSDDVVLYWAHHEKLCIVDGQLAFMGGLDMCFGRWDTNSHPIADAHPSNLDDIVFPGQDYNNARVYDFADVDEWEKNKLDRTKHSRMGWSDVSISLKGHIVNSLMTHFADRWNYIYNGKYATRGEGYQRIEMPRLHHIPASIVEGTHRLTSRFQHHLQRGRMGRLLGQDGQDGSDSDDDGDDDDGHAGRPRGDGGLHIQLTRSCTTWSAGHKTEHSICNAYIDAILKAEHFVYIENQFFITATSDEQYPVGNKIGAAIVQRIVRAHQNGEDFGMVVCMPAVPAFAGDLKSDGALGTRAIMEFQYASISRGKHSIYGALVEAGVAEPKKYLRFYNLRNYDRINTTPVMAKAEQDSGVSYESARRDFEDNVQAGYDSEGRDTQGEFGDRYHRYQDAAADNVRRNPALDKTADTVSACYMNGGPDLTSEPWNGSTGMGPAAYSGNGDEYEQDGEAGSPTPGPPTATPTPGPGGYEIAAFVSEELYIHSKVLIADDRLVICGSANLNDRSQLGTHDSEIAVVIEDPEHPVGTTMAGKPYVVSEFPASLRRHLFRKHLGLLPDQKCDAPNQNWTPVTTAPNDYDWDSVADRLVADPLSLNFTRLWQGTAAANTAVFDDVFHCVPTDRVRTWAQYESYFSKHFIIPGEKETEKDKKEREKALAQIKEFEAQHGEGNFPSPAPEGSDPSSGDHASSPTGGPGGKIPFKVDYGHVVPGFPGGPSAVKARLAEVRGNLVEMPLDFLVDVDDIAKEGLSLNSLTQELYT